MLKAKTYTLNNKVYLYKLKVDCDKPDIVQDNHAYSSNTYSCLIFVERQSSALASLRIMSNLKRMVTIKNMFRVFEKYFLQTLCKSDFLNNSM
jgi:hypothetical protein